MDKRVYCFHYGKAKEKADEVIEKKGNLIELVYRYEVSTSEETRQVALHFTGVKPHEDYPDHFIVVSFKRTGKIISEHYGGFMEKETNLVHELSLSLPDITLNGRHLVGLKKNITRDELGRKETFYDHFFCEIKPIDQKPVATEWYEGIYLTEKRSNGSKIKWYPTKRVKYNYFEINGAYYEGPGDLLKDAISGETETIVEETLGRMSYLLPFIGTERELRNVFPEFIYKNYMLLTYFSPRLLFNKNLEDVSENYEGKIILPNETLSCDEKVQGYVSFNRFLFAYKEKHSQKERIEDVKIYDKNLFGETLYDYQPNETVVVVSPNSYHAPLKDFEGSVIGRSGDEILVQFFGFERFKEKFSLGEIRPKEVTLLANEG